MDRLQNCADTYLRLLNYEYEFTIGSKGKLVHITLFFEESRLMHLMGLHKLTDLQLQRLDKNKVLEKIVNGELTYENIAKSVYFDEVKGTAIEAAFTIISEIDDRKVYYFIDADDKENTRFYGRTFFARDTVDNKFIVGQQKFKTLKKVKINKKTGEEYIMLNKLKES